MIISIGAITWEPTSVLPKRRPARGIPLPISTFLSTKCWQNLRPWPRMVCGRCDRGQSRRSPERRFARPSWRSGAFVSVACSGERSDCCAKFPSGTPYGLFARWTRLGLWRRMLDRLRRTWRRACGDAPEPSAVVIDSRSCCSAPSCFVVSTAERRSGASKSMLRSTNTLSVGDRRLAGEPP
jgi:hypothetical protein